MTEEVGVSIFFSCKVVGGLIETVNPSSLGEMIWELHRMERHYRHLIRDDVGVEIPDLCENIITVYYVKNNQSKDQGYRLENVPGDYDDVIHRYLEGLPIAYRLDAFKEISRIIDRHAKM